MMLFYECHLLNLQSLWDFNAHVGIDTDTWKGVIGKHGVTGLNENGRYLLQLCCSNGLRIMNTFFQHREVHKYTWYRRSMDQKSLIDFCIVLSDLFSDVLDVRVKRGAELSTDHHLVVYVPYDFRNLGQAGDPADRLWPTGSNGRLWRTKK